MNKVFTRHSDGSVSWECTLNDKYVVTGVTVDGKRFKKTFDDWRMARSINLYRGTKWLLRDGKRYKLQTVNN